MCQLKRMEFSEAKRCQSELQKLLYSETDIGIISDKILSNHSKNSVLIVLAATILRKSSIVNDEYSLYSRNWAQKYQNKIGFLGESIKIKNAPVVKIEGLIHSLVRKH